jgi:mercuric ion transport protein
VIRERLAAGGAVAAAFVSCLCWVGPVVAVGLGFGAVGATVELLRPYLVAASVVALGFGFREIYRRSSETFGAGGTYASQRWSRATRTVLWIAALAVLATSIAPYAAGPLALAFSEATTTAPAKTTLEVKGMTCAGCETTVVHALERTSGVTSASVSFERGEAVVDYDPARVTPAEVSRELTRQTGYEAAPKEQR